MHLFPTFDADAAADDGPLAGGRLEANGVAVPAAQRLVQHERSVEVVGAAVHPYDDVAFLVLDRLAELFDRFGEGLGRSLDHLLGGGCRACAEQQQ